MLHLEVPGGGRKVLLHCCCAPCSGAVVECLVHNGIRPTLFFSNSNIAPREEYDHRRSELERYAALYGLPVVDDVYDHAAWMDFVVHGDAALAAAPERGGRCLGCFKFRLLRAARYAAANGFDTLATTLASSRWKSLGQVDEAGRWACGMQDMDSSPNDKGAAHDPSAVGQADASANSTTSPAGQASSTPAAAGQAGSTTSAAGQAGTSAGSTTSAAGPADASANSTTAAAGQAAPLVWWAQNWRKGGLQPRRAEIVREQNFYNQSYCGCEFSEHHETQ